MTKQRRTSVWIRCAGLVVWIGTTGIGCKATSLAIGSNDAGAGTICQAGFHPAPFPAVLATSHAVTSGDLNGDHVPDLIVSGIPSSPSIGVSVLLGHGDGTFAPRVSYPTMGGWSIAVDDFNRDGRLDVAFADEFGGGVVVMLGLGGGALGVPVKFPVGDTVFTVKAADVNADDVVDLLVVSHMNVPDTAGRVTVLLGLGDGYFKSGESYPSGLGLAVADLDGDGKLDLATATPDGASVLLGSGDGTFAPPTLFPGIVAADEIALGDLNADGRPDLAVVETQTNRIAVFLNAGDGTLGRPREFAAFLSPTNVTIGDLDGDGRPELVTVNSQTSDVGILPGNGDGSFRPQQSLDIGTGTLGFVDWDNLPTPPCGAGTPCSDGAPTSIVIDDLNGDQRPDLAITRILGERVSVLLNGCSR